MTSIVAFDLDGTLFHHDGTNPDYSNPVGLARSTKPHADRCLLVRSLIEQGWEVHFITGRGQIHRLHTLAAISQHISPTVKPARVHQQLEFTGYEAMSAFKADILNRIGAELYVGDHPADREAVRMVGEPCRFEWAHEYFPLLRWVTP